MYKYAYPLKVLVNAEAVMPTRRDNRCLDDANKGRKHFNNAHELQVPRSLQTECRSLWRCVFCLLLASANIKTFIESISQTACIWASYATPLF